MAFRSCYTTMDKIQNVNNDQPAFISCKMDANSLKNRTEIYGLVTITNGHLIIASNFGDQGQIARNGELMNDAAELLRIRRCISICEAIAIGAFIV